MGAGESFLSYENKLLKDEKARAYIVPNTEEKGKTGIIRCFEAKEGFAGYLKSQEEKEEIELDTAWKLFNSGVKQYGNNDFVGFRPWIDEKDPSARGEYKWITYKSFYNNFVLPWGNGISTLNLSKKKQSNIGIFSYNRPEWYGIHMGNLSQSNVTVALYDTLGPTVVAYITSHAECELIVCEKDKLNKMFSAIKDIKSTMDDEKNERYDVYKGYKLKYIIQIDYNEQFGNLHEKVNDEDKKTAKELGIELYGLSEILEKGKNKQDIVEPTKDDLAYIMYTSGTTGDPKGVMLDHKSFASMTASGSRKFGNGPDDVHISYLPLAHIFESAAQALMTSCGAKVAYHQGDIRKIADDWKAIRPTFLIGVPRVYGKTYDRFEASKAKMKGVKKWLVDHAQETSTKQIRKTKPRRASFYDKLVWSKVPPQMGFDRIKILVSAAAPLPPHVAEFLRLILPNAAVFQGYGMTETCAGGTATDADDDNLGHVGVPQDNSEIRLVDAPECDYLTTDKPHPRGEIQIRCLAGMSGYYKNEEATKKTLSKDGWLSTGDIGRLNPNYTISIIDRRKNLFKISSGEYIASEKVEAQYQKVRSISQCFVYANSSKPFIVGVVVPDGSNLMDYFGEQKWATEEEIKLAPGTQEFADKFNEISSKHVDDIKKKISQDIEDWKKEGETGLLKFEYFKDFIIEPTIDVFLQGWNVDNGCLTPTYKKKRPQLTRKYMDQIKQMYTALGEPPKDGEHW